MSKIVYDATLTDIVLKDGSRPDHKGMLERVLRQIDNGAVSGPFAARFAEGR